MHTPDALVTCKDLLQVYMLYVLGFISGLAGGVGSRFMNRNNARGTLLGLSTLQHILDQARFVRSRVNVGTGIARVGSWGTGRMPRWCTGAMSTKDASCSGSRPAACQDASNSPC